MQAIITRYIRWLMGACIGIPLVLCSNPLLAGEPELAIEYPELSVTPLASKRLLIEANKEPKTRWTTHLPIQSSALMTFFSGFFLLQVEKRTDNIIAVGSSSMGLGVGWLGLTLGLSVVYKPYKHGYSTIKKLGDKSRREQLEKERQAEELLKTPASLGSKLTYLALVSNLIMNVTVATQAKDDFVKIWGVLAAITSFSPLLFSYHWGQTYDYHMNYKKRIYGPISRVRFDLRSHENDVIPTLAVSTSF